MADLRTTVERRSAALVHWLSQQPRLLLPGLVLVLLLGSAVLPTTGGAACLALVLVVVAWLTFLSWPVLAPRARVLRVVVLAMLLVLGATRLLG